MKHLFYFILLFGLFSCSDSKIAPEGDIVSRDFKVSEYNKVELNGKFSVFYIQGNKNFINIESYPNFIDNLKIEVKDKTLYISEKKDTKGIDLYNINLYSNKAFNEIQLKDSTSFTISGQLTNSNLNINITDEARFIGAILANKVNLKMNKHSKANIRGSSIDVMVNVKDTTSIIAPFWNIDHLTFNAKNENYAEIKVNKTLKGNLENTSKLIYYGTPSKEINVTDKAILEQKTTKQP